jgi:integrase/recombinase XerD
MALHSANCLPDKGAMQKPPPLTGPSGIVRNRDDAFGKYARQFHTHLEGQGYAPSTLDGYRRCLNTLGALLRQRRIALAELTEVEAVQLLTKPKTTFRQSGVVRHFLRFLRDQGARPPVVAPTPPTRSAHEALRRDYEAYLRHQRGATESTIYAYWRLADRFLGFRFGDRMGNLATITQADIVAFLQHLHVREQPIRLTGAATELRSFCRYLFRSGQIPTNLALGVPSIARRDRLPVRDRKSVV